MSGSFFGAEFCGSTDYDIAILGTRQEIQVQYSLSEAGKAVYPNGDLVYYDKESGCLEVRGSHTGSYDEITGAPMRKLLGLIIIPLMVEELALLEKTHLNPDTLDFLTTKT